MGRAAKRAWAATHSLQRETLVNVWKAAAEVVKRVDLPGALNALVAGSCHLGLWSNYSPMGWLQEVATWAFGDWVFGQEQDWFSNVTRMRHTGFQGMQIDSKDMFLGQFQELRAEKVIP